MAKEKQPKNEPPAEEFDFPRGFYRTPTGVAYVPRHIGVGEEGEVELYEKDSGVSRVTLVPYLPVDKDKISALSLDARFDPRTLEEMLKSEATPEGLKAFLRSRHAQSQPKSTGARPYWGGMAPWSVGDDDALMEGDFTP